MHTRSIDVAPSPIYSFTFQRHLLLCKNSIINVLVVFMSWIIVRVNYIFSLYPFPFAHSKDDDEWDDDLRANGWIFNTLLNVLLNSFSTYVFLNNSASYACLCLCSPFCTSFSLLFVIVFQLHSLHPYYCEFQNLENVHNFQQKT
jgi:hypothetical protein